MRYSPYRYDAAGAAGDSEAKDLIESVIEELEMGGPIEGAST